MEHIFKWALDKTTPGAVGIFAILAFVVVVYLQLKPKFMALGISQTAEFQARMLARIAELEKAGVERERTHAAELKQLREEFDEERELLREEIRGLHRQLLQMAQSAGVMAVLPAVSKSPTAVGRMVDELTKEQSDGCE